MRRAASAALALASLLLASACATSHETATADGGGQREVVSRPEWQVGDRWTFDWKEGTSRGRYTSLVTEATDTGYTFQHGDALWYLTPDWEVISIMKDGVVTYDYSPPLPIVRFPMRAGMSWKQGEGLAASGSS